MRPRLLSKRQEAVQNHQRGQRAAVRTSYTSEELQGGGRAEPKVQGERKGLKITKKLAIFPKKLARKFAYLINFLYL